tara:strand:+ start:1077 stop:1826 length:750 start_codon:yes stop_codon:yes gene_type:complete
MKACVIIPARFSSSRFPGKPLEKLLGKPMILWVAEVSSKAVGDKNVYIATDDERIYHTVKSAGFGALMTSNNALTGTDRVAEASKALDYDIFINVQGDEPLIDYNDIRKCIDLKFKYPDYVINGFSKITSKENPSSINIPKVVTNEKNFMLYMSRQLIPGYKSKLNKPISIKKQVCIYGFNSQELEEYFNYGRKSLLETYEDIEILRFLELDKKILMYKCKNNSHAVDIPEDLIKVENLLKKRNENNRL